MSTTIIFYIYIMIVLIMSYFIYKCPPSSSHHVLFPHSTKWHQLFYVLQQFFIDMLYALETEEAYKGKKKGGSDVPMY